MKITVLLSVFNGENWIVDSIESILNQSFKDFEFLIINDGSSDSTKEILNQYQKKDIRIKVIHQKNIGLTASLMKGLEIAKGDWIARIDSDDIACADRLKKQYNFARKTNSCLVGCQSVFISKSGEWINSKRIPNNHENLIKNLKLQKRFFAHSSAFFKKETALKVGSYRLTMKRSQDYDLWLRLSEKGKISCMNYVGVCIREHETRISSKNFGLEQRIFAHCANISRLIRNKSSITRDPLNQNNEKQAKYFINFVHNELKERSIIDFYIRLHNYKKSIQSNNLILRIAKIFIYFNDFKSLLILTRWLLEADYISMQIYKKWQEEDLYFSIN